MKKIIFVIIFLVGLGVFSYPFISNMFATTAHQSSIKEYHEIVESLDEEELKKEKEKIEKHNEELASSDLNFVDPFSENKADAESTGATSYYDALNLGPAIASVRIPKIDVELPVYHGTSEDVLSRGAGHLENSSLPTQKLGTHSVITAHRGLPSAKLFRNLDKLEIGDHFYVEVLDEIIAYEVESIDIVLPTETDWLTMDEGENKMTLLTCDPYMINTHRMLVTGHQIPYEPDEVEEVSDQEDYTPYYIAGAIAAFVLLLLFILIRRKKKDKKGGRRRK